MEHDLGIYIGEFKFNYFKGVFTQIQLSKWKIWKKINKHASKENKVVQIYCCEVSNYWSFLYPSNKGYCITGP